MYDCLVLQNIQKHVSLSEEEQQLFLSKVKTSTVSKGTLILCQDDLCNKLYFVEQGSLRAYNLNKQGKESTIMFAVKDWWITDMNAFVNQVPALVSIQVIEPCQLVALDYKTLEDLYKSIPKLERFFRILFQKAYIREQLRALDNISLTTEERYANFVQKYPKIVKKITQKQIASYLGVTPEFLSAIKKK